MKVWTIVAASAVLTTGLVAGLAAADAQDAARPAPAVAAKPAPVKPAHSACAVAWPYAAEGCAAARPVRVIALTGR